MPVQLGFLKLGTRLNRSRGSMGTVRKLCSPQFLLGGCLVLWGACALGVALGTFSITSSFFSIFPFGSPLWLGGLFVVLGVFAVAVFRPREQPLHSKPQVYLVLVVAVLAVGECLLAIALAVVYSHATSPALSRCSPSLDGCRCSAEFTDPPSLTRTVFTFAGASNCSVMGKGVQVFRSVLLAFYCLGVVLAVFTAGAAIKALHSLGVCAESGIYTVSITPDISYVSRGTSFSSSHPSGHMGSATQRLASTSHSTPNHSPPATSAHPHPHSVVTAQEHVTASHPHPSHLRTRALI